MKQYFCRIIFVILCVGCFSCGQPAKKETGSFQAYVDILVSEGEGKLSESQLKEAENQLRLISAEFSGQIIPYLLEAYLEGLAFRIRNETITTPNLFGFEELGIENSQLSKLWSRGYYPARWIEGNVIKIIFQKKAKKFSDDNNLYNLEGYKAGEAGDFRHQVTLFGDPGEVSPQTVYSTKGNLDWHFSHELGHNNDWINAPYLSARERLDLLVAVLGLYKGPRLLLQDYYLGSITDPNPLKQNYYRAREWWATTCEYYFTFPGTLKESRPEWFALVDSHVKKYDPSYNTMTKQKEREKVLMKLIGRKP